MSKEELGGALYTALVEKRAPCSVQDLCAGITGLSKRQSVAKELLDKLCYTGIIISIGDKYVVSEEAEKYQVGTECDRLAEAVGPLLTLDHGRLRPQVNTYSAGPDHSLLTNVKDRPTSHRRPVLDVVPRQQQHVVQKTSQQVVDCDPSSVTRCVDDIHQILRVLRTSPVPLHGSKIAQLSGIGQSKKEVNRTLYFIAERGLIKKNEKTEWACQVDDISDGDVQTYGVELASKPERKQRQTAGPGTGMCECSKEGKNCYHFHQHFTHNQYNVQVGDNSTMYFTNDAK